MEPKQMTRAANLMRYHVEICATLVLQVNNCTDQIVLLEEKFPTL